MFSRLWQIIAFFIRLFRRREVPQTENDADKAEDFYESVREQKACPDCGKISYFLRGPEEGPTFNLLCAACFSEFTVGPDFVRKLGKLDMKRLPVYGLEDR